MGGVAESVAVWHDGLAFTSAMATRGRVRGVGLGLSSFPPRCGPCASRPAYGTQRGETPYLPTAGGSPLTWPTSKRDEET